MLSWSLEINKTVIVASSWFLYYLTYVDDARSNTNEVCKDDSVFRSITSSQTKRNLLEYRKYFVHSLWFVCYVLLSRIVHRNITALPHVNVAKIRCCVTHRTNKRFVLTVLCPVQHFEKAGTLRWRNLTRLLSQNLFARFYAHCCT